MLNMPSRIGFPFPHMKRKFHPGFNL